MEEKDLVFTISGIRGIYGKSLNNEITKKIAVAYGLWLKGEVKEVIIGRDTRPSGEAIEKLIIEGLASANCKVINLGICPTPVIIYAKNRLDTPGGIIISASHNPPEWNGLKLLSNKTLLRNSELNEIHDIMNEVDLKKYKSLESNQIPAVKNLNITPEYIQDLYKFINVDSIKEDNNLNVAIDTGAGAATEVTPQILKDMGCTLKIINNELDEKGNFPREIEPVEKNLTKLKKLVLEGSYDVGFAHDCDADRLAIIGNDGTFYPEDIGLALIANSYFKEFKDSGYKMIFVTNLASSLIFEALAEKYGAQVIRTPVGERYLAEEMNKLMKSEKESSIIFGGEGSCGGVMFPQFNNTRDGIFAAAKLIEILVETKEKLSDLVAKLPQFYSIREYINIKNINLNTIIIQVKDNLISEGYDVSQIHNDLRFGKGNEWFVLIHPSNTEPILRVISEAKNESLANENLLITAEKVKFILSKL